MWQMNWLRNMASLLNLGKALSAQIGVNVAVRNSLTGCLAGRPPASLAAAC
jgi:hypothetical protein